MFKLCGIYVTAVKRADGSIVVSDKVRLSGLNVPDRSVVGICKDLLARHELSNVLPDGTAFSIECEGLKHRESGLYRIDNYEFGFINADTIGVFKVGSNKNGFLSADCGYLSDCIRERLEDNRLEPASISSWDNSLVNLKFFLGEPAVKGYGVKAIFHAGNSEGLVIYNTEAGNLLDGVLNHMFQGVQVYDNAENCLRGKTELQIEDIVMCRYLPENTEIIDFNVGLSCIVAGNMYFIVPTYKLHSLNKGYAVYEVVGDGSDIRYIVAHNSIGANLGIAERRNLLLSLVHKLEYNVNTTTGNCTPLYTLSKTPVGQFGQYIEAAKSGNYALYALNADGGVSHFSILFDKHTEEPSYRLYEVEYASDKVEKEGRVKWIALDYNRVGSDEVGHALSYAVEKYVTTERYITNESGIPIPAYNVEVRGSGRYQSVVNAVSNKSVGFELVCLDSNYDIIAAE